MTEQQQEEWTYSVRPTIRNVTYTFALKKEALEVAADTGRHDVVPFKDITAVRVSRAGLEEPAFNCVIRTARGEKYAFGSHTFTGRAAVSRVEEFVPFVAALHRALEPYGERIEFAEGSPANFYGIRAAGIFLLVFAAAAAAYCAAKGKGISLPAMLGLGTAVVVGLVLLPLAGMFKPRVYDPRRGELPYGFERVTRTREGGETG